MRRNHGPSCPRMLTYVLITVCVCVVASASMAASAGQFPRLPKLKLPGQKQTKPTPPQGRKEVNALPAPEVTAITPDSAPPGGFGEMVLTGKNFTPGTRLRLSCQGGEIHSKSFKVESAERATVQISVPTETREGPCSMELVRFAAKEGSEAETDESPSGTPEIFQVPENGPTFKISSSGKMPVGFELVLLGEGDMNFMDMMQKMAQEAQGGFGPGKMKQGQLLLAPDSVKYLQEDKTVFSKSPSSVKNVEEMTMMGKSTGVFRIVFGDGKIYNFRGAEGGDAAAHKDFLIIKKKLGK